MVNIGNSWDNVLKEEFQADYYKSLREFLKSEYSTKTIYPNMYDIFNAFRFTSYEDVKVVILGQDPYINERQAHGLAFSVQEGVYPPPSLINIFKLLKDDLGVERGLNGCLVNWAKQGVLLLNTTLTVVKGQSGSHRGHGWETFTDNVISKLNDRKEPILFVLWGSNARSKKKLITNPVHEIIETVHPSPLSCYNGFFESHHFALIEDFLKRKGYDAIDFS